MPEIYIEISNTNPEINIEVIGSGPPGPPGATGATGATGVQGETGETGPKGEDGFSPEFSVTEIAGGYQITVTDVNGSQSFDLMDGENGEDGADGADGADGVSPTITVTDITGGHRVSITDAESTSTFDIMDGDEGPTGPAGPGVPNGGSLGQMLVKNSAADQDTKWDSNAYRAVSIPYGKVDNTSTSTAFTATVPGITELRDGVCMWLMNGKVTSASGFTININNLGAKPAYSSLAAATRSTTLFNVNYTMLFIYNENRVEGGCWDIVYGYDSNTTYTPPKLGFGFGTCDTAAATVAKTCSISSYALTTGGFVTVKFTNAVPASATLNISSKGAKPIWYHGAAIAAGAIRAGDYVTFVYSGSYYHVVSIDRSPTAADVGAIAEPATANDDDVLTFDNGDWVAKPPSGPGQWTKLIDWTAAEDVVSVTFTKGDNDEVLADCTEMWLLMLVCPQTSTEYTTGIKAGFNGTSAWSHGHTFIGYGIKSSVTGSFMYMLHLVKTPMGIICDARNQSYDSGGSIKMGTFVNRATTETATGYTGLENNSKNIGADLDELLSDTSFEKILVGGYQTVIGTGSQIRIWGR